MGEHKLVDWARLLDLQDILAERDRLISALTMEYRAAQKQLAASQAEVAILREALLHQLFDLHNYSSRPCTTCERSRKALGDVEIGCGELAPSFNHTALERALAALKAKSGAG